MLKFNNYNKANNVNNDNKLYWKLLISHNIF